MLTNFKKDLSLFKTFLRLGKASIVHAERFLAFSQFVRCFSKSAPISISILCASLKANLVWSASLVAIIYWLGSQVPVYFRCILCAVYFRIIANNLQHLVFDGLAVSTPQVYWILYGLVWVSIFRSAVFTCLITFHVKEIETFKQFKIKQHV